MDGMPATDSRTALRMAKQRTRDTAAELLLRRLLHGRGLRYRVDAAIPQLPRRRGDLIFTASRVAVFVDGCFWHGCPEHRTAPRNNADWWLAKLTRNVERDQETDAHLTELGWRVVRIWEHEDPNSAADRVEAAVRSGQPKS